MGIAIAYTAYVTHFTDVTYVTSRTFLCYVTCITHVTHWCHIRLRVYGYYVTYVAQGTLHTLRRVETGLLLSPNRPSRWYNIE